MMDDYKLSAWKLKKTNLWFYRINSLHKTYTKLDDQLQIIQFSIFENAPQNFW